MSTKVLYVTLARRLGGRLRSESPLCMNLMILDGAERRVYTTCSQVSNVRSSSFEFWAWQARHSLALQSEKTEVEVEI